jgi:RNA polymerase sigma factor for flagellar operon FliA
MVVPGQSKRMSEDVHVARLWKSFFAQPDHAGKERLFLLYRDFASRVSLGLYKRYSGLGVCADDFLQNGYLGLYRAIEKFQIDRGAHFETFAAYRIKGEILNGLHHYSESIDLYQYRKQLEQERIASILNAGGNRQDVQSLLRVALDVVTSSIVELAELDQKDLGGLEGESIDLDHSSFSQCLVQLLQKLPAAHQKIITMHYFYEYSFAEIADIVGKSKSAVFKMHAKALEQFRILLAQADKELMVI